MRAFIINLPKTFTFIALTALAIGVSACGVDTTQNDSQFTDQQSALELNTCNADNRLEAEACEPLATKDNVCCYLDNAFELTHSSQCRADQVAALDRCDTTDTKPQLPNAPATQHTCCNIDGSFEMTNHDDCRPDRIVAVDNCIAPPAEDAPVCCNTETGPIWTRPTECRPDDHLAAAACETNPVPANNTNERTCCDVHGVFTMMFVNDCRPEDFVDAQNCVVEVVVEEAPETNGNETVCCDYDGNFEMTTANDCEAEMVVDHSSCDIETQEETVCCHVMGEFEWTSSDDCQGMDQTDAHMCGETTPDPFGTEDPFDF